MRLGENETTGTSIGLELRGPAIPDTIQKCVTSTLPQLDVNQVNLVTSF